MYSDSKRRAYTVVISNNLASTSDILRIKNRICQYLRKSPSYGDFVNGGVFGPTSTRFAITNITLITVHYRKHV
nr:MAG TPA: hypothetical protein [Caudoviricetes sp.]